MSEVTPDSLETQRLLVLARAEDREAFERLFARHRKYLRDAIALRLDPRVRARVDPSDVVQGTQLEVFRRLPDFLDRRPMPFRLWLLKTAQEQLLVIRRRHVVAGKRAVGREVPLPQRSSVVLARQLIAPTSTPSQQLDGKALARRVRVALARLAEADQEIIMMRAFEGLSNREVACVLDLDPGTASKRHGRAVLRLQKILAEDGLTESQP
jgi:RNA polymerase sigma-70 factor (ECF subfamily)